MLTGETSIKSLRKRPVSEASTMFISPALWCSNGQGHAKHLFPEKSVTSPDGYGTAAARVRSLRSRYGRCDRETGEVTILSWRRKKSGSWSTRGGSKSLEPFSSLSVFRILPLRGTIILRFDEAMINSLINVYFGGTFGPPVGRNKDGFRESEIAPDRTSRAIADRAALRPFF